MRDRRGEQKKRTDKQEPREGERRVENKRMGELATGRSGKEILLRR